MMTEILIAVGLAFCSVLAMLSALFFIDGARILLIRWWRGRG